MEQLKKKKRYIWFSIAGLLLIPYPLLIGVGILTNHYPALYRYTNYILYGFLTLVALFVIILIRAIANYKKYKNSMNKSDLN